MKLSLIITLSILAVLTLAAAFNYLRQRRSQQRIQTQGMVLYGAVLSATRLGGWLKPLGFHDMQLRIQEPGQAPREVKLRARLPPEQSITPGLSLVVVVDPRHPERVYPAEPEATKRVTVGGTRQEQRRIRAQVKHPHRFRPRPNSGYQPPTDKLR